MHEIYLQNSDIDTKRRLENPIKQKHRNNVRKQEITMCDIRKYAAWERRQEERKEIR